MIYDDGYDGENYCDDGSNDGNDYGDDDQEGCNLMVGRLGLRRPKHAGRLSRLPGYRNFKGCHCQNHCSGI